MSTTGRQRDFSRQTRVFPPERRQQTSLVELGASPACHCASTLLKAGGAAAGVAGIWSDYAGPQRPADSCWWHGPHATLIKAVAGDEAVLDYVDPLSIVEDIAAIVRRCRFPWLVLHLQDPAAACEMALQLARCPIEMRMLLAFAGPSGVLVERTTSSAAVSQLAPLRGVPLLAARPSSELAMLEAGAVLSEIMLGDPANTTPRKVLLYSLQRQRRVDCPPQTSLAEIVAELSTPLERATFFGRRGMQVGIGGLGNISAIAIALDEKGHAGPSKSLLVMDGDAEIASSNGNRQFLFCGRIGQGPKAAIAAKVLRQIDPLGTYEGQFRAVKKPADLQGRDADYLLVMPDNNEARLLGGDVAWEGGLLMATAATTATSGYAAVQQPGRACLRCVAHLDGPPAGAGEHASCSTVEDDSIVATNMVCGALAVSELREAVSGRRATNLNFHGTNRAGNCLTRKISDPPCAHRANAGCRKAAPTG
jgi:molybdopterin/thiamine biosynthesis adenylyltransferase